jgi:hypothetical protein
MVALCLIHRLFAVNLPADLVKRVYADPLNLAFVGLVQGRLFREDSGLPGLREWFQYMLGPPLPLVRRSGLHSPWHCFLLYIRAVLIPEFSDIHALHLAKGLSILHYFYRFFRLFRKHGWGLLARVR